MNKYEKYYNDNNLKSKRRIVIDMLAADLQEKTGMKARVSGPFGLRAECPIYLNEDAGKGEGYFIVIIPSFKRDTLELYYDTGETKIRFDPGTIGDINGFNNVIQRLPDTLDEIIQCLIKI